MRVIAFNYSWKQRTRVIVLSQVYICSHAPRHDVSRELFRLNLVKSAPVEQEVESRWDSRMAVGPARMFVANLRGEEFPKARLRSRA
jgi:hypothetical protein